MLRSYLCFGTLPVFPPNYANDRPNDASFYVTGLVIPHTFPALCARYQAPSGDNTHHGAFILRGHSRRSFSASPTSTSNSLLVGHSFCSLVGDGACLVLKGKSHHTKFFICVRSASLRYIYSLLENGFETRPISLPDLQVGPWLLACLNSFQALLWFHALASDWQNDL
jgi:hypothetical protein